MVVLARTCAIALAMIVLASMAARADRIGYNGVADISSETSTLRVEHHHDWSKGYDALWKMIATTKDPFTDENNYSYLQLTDKATGAVLFRRPVPALSYIWISPSSKYVVGISNIKLWNPYQIVVYDKSGNCLFKRDLVGMNLTGARESVSNWIEWYRKPVPKIEIVENGAVATLLVEDPLGSFNKFQFTTVH